MSKDLTETIAKKLGIMEIIAKELGIELDEVFKLKSTSNEKFFFNYYKLTDMGLRVFKNNQWMSCFDFEDILTGKCEIIKLPWKPKNSGQYYYYDTAIEACCPTKWQNTYLDEINYVLGNCFKTSEEVFVNKEKIKNHINNLRLQAICHQE